MTLTTKARVILMLCLLSLGMAAQTANSPQTTSNALFQKAESLAADNTAAALAAFELVMQQSAETDPRLLGRAMGEYWDLIQKQNNYPRAYDFFSQLAAAHPGSADVLGAEGSAIGGYLGWLQRSGLGELADQQFLAKLKDHARETFERALKIDSRNFGALFGYAIYESYQPGGKSHSRELFAKLDTLRADRPYYPWSYVDQMKKQRLGNE